jgi:hypothetical protein
MRLAALVVLALVGVALMAAGVAVIYWPAALILVGVLCVAVAFVVEVRDT